MRGESLRARVGTVVVAGVKEGFAVGVALVLAAAGFRLIEFVSGVPLV